MTKTERLKKLEEVCSELPSTQDEVWLVSRGFHRSTLLFDWKARLEEYIEGGDVVTRTKGVLGASLCLMKDTLGRHKFVWKALLEIVYWEEGMDHDGVKTFPGVYRVTPQAALADVMDKLPGPYKWRVRPQ